MSDKNEIKKTILNKKTSSAVEFWRNVYICRVADEGKFSKQFIMDFAKVTKISLHLQQISLPLQL